MVAKNIIVAPSILAADFSQIGEEVVRAEESGADWIHMDIMDGVFVPPITFGSQMTKAVRGCTRLPLDVHLMTVHPDRHVASFAEAGADYITFHAEAAVHANRVVQSIRDRGCKPGISLVPSTPISALEELLPHIDLVLIMTVNPGYGGQALIPDSLDKVRRLAEMRGRRGADFLISVDGGINRETSAEAIDAGIDVAVAGSAFFGAENPAMEVNILKGKG